MLDIGFDAGVTAIHCLRRGRLYPSLRGFTGAGFGIVFDMAHFRGGDQPVAPTTAACHSVPRFHIVIPNGVR